MQTNHKHSLKNMRSASLKHQNEHFLEKKRRIIWRFKKKPYLCTRIKKTTSRSGAVVARWAHNPKVVRSNRASATKQGNHIAVIPFLFITHLTLTPRIVQEDIYRKSPTNCEAFLLWALTDSNRRPSACKADALNQLS